MTALLLAQPRGTPSPGPGQGSPVSRWAVLRAQQYAEESQTTVLPPSQLAAQLGVSLRTLHRGFHEELGTTPQAFFSGSACAGHIRSCSVRAPGRALP